MHLLSTDKVNTSIPQSLSKPVFLHNVVCSKSDLTLLECSFTKYSGNNNNVQDIVINCKLREYTLMNSDIQSCKL